MASLLRSVVATLGAVAMLATVAPPAQANPAQMASQNGPLLLDVLVMRPVGFVMFVTGIGLFALSAPLVLVTRPTEIGEPFHALVGKPARYVWVDPLGDH